MKILSVVGARPQFVKAMPLHRAMMKIGGKVKPILLHTGQHYDYEMSKVFFENLKLPEPDYHLGIGSGTHAKQIGAMLEDIGKALLVNSKAHILERFGLKEEKCILTTRRQGRFEIQASNRV